MNIYQVLKRPILTEKTDVLRDAGQYVFEVDRQANKLQVKQAVETVFGVKVLAVNTQVSKSKRRRLGRRVIQTKSAWKRAVVTLAPGERIQQFFEGV